MGIKQISVFLENTAGRICEVTKILADNDVNIRAINIADTATFGILRIIVDKTDIAYKALAAAELTARLTDVIAVEVEDKPGSLDALMKILHKNMVNIEYLYASLKEISGKAVVIFRLEDMEKGLRILEENSINTVEGF